jgi:hypothetical protein
MYRIGIIIPAFFCSLFADGPRWHAHYEEAYRLIYNNITGITPSVRIIGNTAGGDLQEETLYELLNNSLHEKNIQPVSGDPCGFTRLEIVLFLENGSTFIEVALLGNASLAINGAPVSSVIWKNQMLLDESSSSRIYPTIKFFVNEILDRYLVYTQTVIGLLVPAKCLKELYNCGTD